jgi:hypothetical protein
MELAFRENLRLVGENDTWSVRAGCCGGPKSTVAVIIVQGSLVCFFSRFRGCAAYAAFWKTRPRAVLSRTEIFCDFEITAATPNERASFFTNASV